MALLAEFAVGEGYVNNGEFVALENANVINTARRLKFGKVSLNDGCRGDDNSTLY